ncbi:hypothetical protein COOONC_10171 [Cooperia oncophora]
MTAPFFRMRLLLPLTLISAIGITGGQISAMFGNPIQAPNCESWSEWGPCVWLKGSEKRFQRPYFDQLLPGRKGCRTHVFFRLLKDRWGTILNRVFARLSTISTTTYEKLRLASNNAANVPINRAVDASVTDGGDVAMINPLFVAERRCMGIDQNKACTSKYMPDCKLWPNPQIQLPNVTESMQQIIDGLDYLSCVPQQR